MPEQPSWRAATSTVHLLHRASQGMDEIFLRAVGGDLTPRQFVILDAVAEAEGLNQVAITQATGIDRSSTAELVQRLTQAGRELLAKMRPAAERMDRTLAKRLGGRAALRRLVEQTDSVLSTLPRT
jgi:DNA-binding MarR family transcriptional regulator